LRLGNEPSARFVRGTKRRQPLTTAAGITVETAGSNCAGTVPGG